MLWKFFESLFENWLMCNILCAATNAELTTPLMTAIFGEWKKKKEEEHGTKWENNGNPQEI